MDQTYSEAVETAGQDRREALAAAIHEAAHPQPVMDCPQCDLRYLDSRSLDDVMAELETSIADAQR